MLAPCNEHAVRTALGGIHNAAKTGDGYWVALFPFEQWAFESFVWSLVESGVYAVYNYALQPITKKRDPGEWSDHGVYVVWYLSSTLWRVSRLRTGAGQIIAKQDE
jgi:hypothetical protein